MARTVVLAALALALLAAPALAQPSKPEVPVTPVVSKTDTIKITAKRFGSLKIGARLTLGSIKKVFPKAKVTKTRSPAGWKIEHAATKLVATADPEKIVIDGGPVEVHGVMIGDNGGELSSGSFAGAYCYAEQDAAGVVVCNKDAVVVRLASCGATTADANGAIPPAGLKGCVVQQISWIAYAKGR
jgi:hypothetical protein